MMRRVTLAAALVLGLACAASAQAAVSPQPGPGDPRIRVVRYDPNEVVELKAVLGYQITIEFGAGERVENVSIGDGMGWQVTPNHKANLLFIKPLDVGSATDMTVVTNLRRYVFDLSARRPIRRAADPGVIFRLRFDYPEVFVVRPDPKPAPPPPAPPRDVNHAYSWEGSARLLPRRMFDDGRFTYFVFGPGMDLPAVFAVDGDHKESMVNSAVRDGYVVVDRLAEGFVLRQGGEVTRIHNDGYHSPGAAQSTLQPAHRRKGWLP